MKTIEDYELDYFDKQSNNNCECKKCHESFIFKPDEAYWIERGTYSEKVTKCPHCGCINAVKYIDGFNQNPNLDQRYFD